MISTDDNIRNGTAAASTTTGGNDTDATTTAIDLSLLDTWIDKQDDDDNNNSDQDRHLALTVHRKRTRLEELTSRQAYESRLQTFRPLTYFCKPTSISPIVCARFGWINTSLDMLQCVSCKAALCVTIHPKIQLPSTVRKLVEAYQAKLATAHKEACPFRFDAEILLLPSKESSATATKKATNNDDDVDYYNTSDLSDDDDDEEDKHKGCRKHQKQQEKLENVVPLHLASILPRDVWTMIESPTPLPLLQTRFNQLSETIIHQSNVVDGVPPKWQFPTINLPQDVLLFGCNDLTKSPNDDADDSGDNEGGSVESHHNKRHSPSRKSRMLARLAFDPSQPYTAMGWEQETLLTKLEKVLHPPTNEQNTIRAQTRNQGAWEDFYEFVAALALFGWMPPAVASAADEPAAISLHCPVCLASLKFKMILYDPHHRHHDNDDEEHGASPPRKRRRLGNDGGDQETAVKSSTSVNPLHAHRYHCPYVCGFPRNGERKATPIWKTIASKVMAQSSSPSKRFLDTTGAPTNDQNESDVVEKEEDCEAKTNRILQLLQSGISTYVSRQSKTNEPDFL